MSIVSLPASFRPVTFDFGQLRFDTMERSDSTGSEAARLLAPPRWTCSITSANHMTLIEAGTWRAWLLSLRGSVNVAAIYDPVRVAPEGTMRGSPVVGVAASAGATSVTIGNAIGTNLLQFQSSYNNAYWTRTNVAVTSNSTTAWDGALKADRIAENTVASVSHVIDRTITADPAKTYTSFIVAKQDTIRYIRVHVDIPSGTNHCRAVFDLQTGTVTETVNAGNGTGVTASVGDLGGGWWLCKITGKPDTSGTQVSFRCYTMNASTGTAVYASGTGTAGYWASDAGIVEGSTVPSLPFYPTLKAGDLLQLGSGVGTSQLVTAIADATGVAYDEAVWSDDGAGTNAAIWSDDGAGTNQSTWSDDGSPSQSLTVTVEPPLRIDFAKGAAVTWDKPLAYYRMQGSPKWKYSTQAWHREGGFAADFVETFNA